MKTYITLFLLSLFTAGFSQSSTFKYEGRSTPSIKKEKLNEAKFANQIMPEFCKYVILPFGERALLNEQLKLIDQPNEYHMDPYKFFDLSLENYSKILYFVSLEISSISKGKTMTSKSMSNMLTVEQKSILNAAEPGTDIRIKIKFKYKNQGNISFYDLEQVKEGEYSVTVVPEKEAEYPGGFKEITNFLIKNVFNKIPDKSKAEKIRLAIVKFTINEEGQVVNAQISRTSKDPQLDKLLLDAINKMPKWKPALNSKGAKIKQEYNIPLGINDGC
jgi:TonB family protein